MKDGTELYAVSLRQLLRHMRLASQSKCSSSGESERLFPSPVLPNDGWWYLVLRD